MKKKIFTTVWASFHDEQATRRIQYGHVVMHRQQEEYNMDMKSTSKLYHRCRLPVILLNIVISQHTHKIHTKSSSFTHEFVVRHVHNGT